MYSFSQMTVEIITIVSFYSYQGEFIISGTLDYLFYSTVGVHTLKYIKHVHQRNNKSCMYNFIFDLLINVNQYGICDIVSQ